MAETKEITSASSAPSCIQLESVNRISKIPVVETTVETGKNIYEKVKDYNSATNWTISTAENTVSKAVEIGTPYVAPVIQSLQGPIKKVDELICSGLDYVEVKVPAVNLPPAQLYNSTKSYISSSSTVQTAKSYMDPAMETAKSTYEGARQMVEPHIETAKKMVEPHYESAKKMVEPTLESAKSMVEPYVQSTKDRAATVIEYGKEKIEGYLHPEGQEEGAPKTCAECAEHDVTCTHCPQPSRDQEEHNY